MVLPDHLSGQLDNSPIARVRLPYQYVASSPEVDHLFHFFE